MMIIVRHVCVCVCVSLYMNFIAPFAFQLVVQEANWELEHKLSVSRCMYTNAKRILIVQCHME